MEIKIPELSLVLLIGTSGAGKSTFATKHFNPYEIVSSDRCRGIVSNDENSLAASADAFDLVHYIIAKRLKNGLLTVVDATNVQARYRKKLIDIARQYHTLPVAIVLDIPQQVCEERNVIRPDRNFGNHVIRRQKQQLKQSLRGLKKEGFRKVYILKSVEEVNSVTSIVREKLYNNKKDITGAFDIIGDIHGCYDETIELMEKLGYQINTVADDGHNFGLQVTHPEDRKIIFVGDLVDRGPKSPQVLKLVMSMVHNQTAYCVIGNHEHKLQKKLKGKKVKLNHGLAETMEQLAEESPEFIAQVKEFLYSLISHYVFDDGKLVVAHAGIKEEMQGRASGVMRSFCMYGETTGEIDEFGLPIRYNWAEEYRGKAKVIYGHVPVVNAQWFNNTIDIDTGCVFGGKLTALRYPEEELVSVPAKQVYYEPIRPLEDNTNEQLTPQQEYDDLLDIEDVIGRRIIHTRLRNNITIREENSIAALEVMSRFAINPKWLIYLPPTMSPSATSELPDFLEHPYEAINYYKTRGVEKVICEEKHMGSRVILVLCRNEETALRRFGIINQGVGVCYTRSGRNFFNDPDLEQKFLDRIVQALEQANFWQEFNTNWVCLDAELMPWSAKAQSLLKDQYASVGAAASNSLTEVESVLQQAINRGISDAQDSFAKFNYKQKAIAKYIDSYRNYCWQVSTVEDYKLAPFHILATEGLVHIDKSHQWHMQTIAQICHKDPTILRATPYQIVDINDPQSVEEVVQWWLNLTSSGGEGMVVKSYDFITHGHGKQKLLQPALKCRGSEYLRIIYGPEYDLSENLNRLKNRGLSRKRSLAIREFSLGIEALERFVRKEPLRRVHECVFGVLSLESEEVDPRL